MLKSRRLKETKYTHKNSEILVRDHIGLFNGKEEVYLDGKLLTTHLSTFFQDPRDGMVIFNDEVLLKNGDKVHLRVVCAMHLDLQSRTHIYVDGELVGGDTKKQIYVPKWHWAMLASFLITIGVLSITDNVVEIFERVSATREFKNKIRSNSKDLEFYEVYHFFKNDSYPLLKAQKTEEWNELCEKNKNHICRLKSYLQTLNGNLSGALKSTLASCSEENALNCYAAFKSPLFSIVHPKYKFIAQAIKNYCVTKKELLQSEKIMCYEFARKYYRETNNFERVKNIHINLCESEFVKTSCHLIKEKEKL